MQQEFAYRREVLERTGIVLVDKNCIPLPQSEEQRLALGEARVVDAQAALPPVIDADAQAAPPSATTSGPNASGAGADGAGTKGADAPDDATPKDDDEDIMDAEIITPQKPEDGAGDAAGGTGATGKN